MPARKGLPALLQLYPMQAVVRTHTRAKQRNSKTLMGVCQACSTLAILGRGSTPQYLCLAGSSSSKLHVRHLCRRREYNDVAHQRHCPRTRARRIYCRRNTNVVKRCSSSPPQRFNQRVIEILGVGTAATLSAGMRKQRLPRLFYNTRRPWRCGYCYFLMYKLIVSPSLRRTSEF